MRLRRYRPMAVLLLVLQLQACTSWRPVTVSPREFIEEEQPSAIRVTRPDGTSLFMENPTVADDSIFSVCRPEDGSSCTIRTGSLSLDDVSALEAPRTDIDKSIGAIIGTGFLLSLVYGALTLDLTSPVRNRN